MPDIVILTRSPFGSGNRSLQIEIDRGHDTVA